MDCIFCKIIKGEIPCQKVAESKEFFAFLDIMPIAEGHTLIVPKRHVKDFSEFPQELGSEFVTFTQDAMRRLLALGYDGINIGMNNGVAAGQAVMHQHTHLIPRWKDDGLKSWPSRKADHENLNETLRKILKKK